MANAAEVDERAHDTSRRRDRKIGWTLVAIAWLTLVVIVVVVVIAKQEDKYGPIETGGFGGVGVSDRIVSDEPDGSGPYRLVTKGNGTAFVYSSLSNAGEHSVRITGIDTDDITVRAQWAPLYESNGSTRVDRTKWRDFPTTIGPEHTFQLRFEIRRPPSCQDKAMTPGSGRFYDDRHVVRWESMLSDNATTIGGDFLDSQQVQVC